MQWWFRIRSRRWCCSCTRLFFVANIVFLIYLSDTAAAVEILHCATVCSIWKQRITTSSSLDKAASVWAGYIHSQRASRHSNATNISIRFCCFETFNISEPSCTITKQKQLRRLTLARSKCPSFSVFLFLAQWSIHWSSCLSWLSNSGSDEIREAAVLQAVQNYCIWHQLFSTNAGLHMQKRKTYVIMISAAMPFEQ